jgi:Domain of unknown function (DUF4351)/Protein of unknown function (DUF3102)
MTPYKNGFNYSSLDQETATLVQACAKTIQSLSLNTFEQMIEVGQQLQIAKENLKHGQFYSWLQLELNMNSRQARRLMHVSRQIKVDKTDFSSALSTLEITPSALYLLAETKTPEAARVEAIDRAALGEAITLRAAKEIVSRHKKQKPHLNENLTLPIANIAEILSPQFCVGNRVRILSRQEGEDKWTGYTAKVWEVTPDGWLRVNIEGHQDIKFTLKPEWVELLEELDMTEPINFRVSPWYQEIMQDGKTEEGQSFVFRLLNRRFGELTPELRTQVQALTLIQLEDLGEALLDFSQPSDLVDWLRDNS